MNGPRPSDHAWWLVSRASGLVALTLITLSVTIGLAMAARLGRQSSRARLAGLHEQIALSALVAIAVHGVTLLGDPWLHPGLRGIAVPFALGYRSLYTGLGIIAGYLAALLGLSFYVRGHIGRRAWRRMHRLMVVAYGLGLVHAVGAGTDSSTPAVRTAMLLSAAPIGLLLAYRLATARRRATPRVSPAVRG
jgi:sulfoxide reductase heme-binding subunit YedZ